MTHRSLIPASIGAVAMAVIGLSMSVAGQTPGPAAKSAATPAAPVKKASRTPWGDPDIQGVYNLLSLTPLERPRQLADRKFLTEAEALAMEQRAVAVNKDEVVVQDGDTGYYNRFWRDPGAEHGPKVVPSRRTSLITDPEDGRLPPMTPEGQRVKAKIQEILDRDGPVVFNRVGPSRLKREGSNLADSYLDRDPGERCIGTSVPAIAGSLVGNNGAQIIQGAGYVLIEYESGSTRIIPLDGRPHQPPAIRSFLGDARGRWDGETLVVDTTNFTDEMGYQGGLPQGRLHLIERFTRADDGSLNYVAVIDDPAHYTQPWTVEFPWPRDDDYVLYEVACHEGNESLTGILSGARATEKAAAQGAGSNSPQGGLR